MPQHSRAPSARPLIFVVTGFPDEQTVYSDWLTYEGFSVRVLSDADLAFKRAVCERPSAVITRVQCPGQPIGGLQLTIRLKTDERTRTIPVLVMTSLADPKVREAATAAGCDAFFLLPCMPEDLLAALREQLAQRGSAVGTPRRRRVLSARLGPRQPTTQRRAS